MITGLFEAPLEALLGVFDVEAKGGKLIADQVGSGPVFVVFGVFADLHEEVYGTFVGFHIRCRFFVANLDAEQIHQHCET